MSFSIGIIGLPNVGKSTLFKSLTKKQVDIAAFPFTTVNPNVGVVAVPDERLEKIARTLKPEKVTPTVIEFVDIAGLVRGAHRGEGLGNQFLARIRECDAILEIVRLFKADLVCHVEKSINPERDIEIIKTELLMKDLETTEKAVGKMKKETKSGDKEVIKKKELLKRIQENLNKGKMAKEAELSIEDFSLIKEFQFLTIKPIIYILNINQAEVKDSRPKMETAPILCFNLKLEEEISELSEAETRELEMHSQLDRLITACYTILDLITFYTVAGGKEVRAWALKKGTNVLTAAGQVHSDFKERFIRAEIVNWEKLVNVGGWSKSREQGWIQAVGKEYVVQGGDVIEFKI